MAERRCVGEGSGRKEREEAGKIGEERGRGRKERGRGRKDSEKKRSGRA